MDFNSLGAGSPFYILHKDAPTLEIGVVKSRNEQRQPYQSYSPATFMNQPNVVDIIVEVNGKEIPFSNLPANKDNTTYNNGNTFVSCNRESVLQAVDAMMQTSKKALEQMDYHNLVMTEGDKMLETLNPRYKEEKQRDRSIRLLEERQEATDKKLDKILSRLEDFFSPPSKK